MNRPPRWFVPGLLALPAVTLVVFYAWPFATLAARGLRPAAAAETLGDATTWRVLWFTTWQAFVSTVLTAAVGLAPAYVMARYEFAGRRALDALLAAVFVLPTVVMGAAILALLPAPLERGAVAVITAHVLFNLAVVVRTVGAVLVTLPRDREGAAATLGASPWRAFRTVTLPAVAPALAAASSIVFVFTFTSYGVVRILGGVRRATVEVEIWRQATQFGDIGAAATLALVQLAAVAAVVALTVGIQRRAGSDLGLGTTSRRERPRTPGRRRLVAVVATMTAVAALAPLIALVERSTRGRGGRSLTAWRNLGRTELRPGVSLGVDPVASLVTSGQAMVVATAIAVTVGTLAALGIAAARRAGTAVNAAITLPIATSAVTIGFGMLITFDTPPVDWRAEWWLVPVGQALVAIPFVTRTVLPVLRGIDGGRLDAAATLGASPLRAWRTVVLPHLRRPALVAAGLTAAISLGEFGATSVLSRAGRETVPVAIERLLGRPGALLQAQGYALAVILAGATIGVVLTLDRPADGPRRGRR